MSDDSGSGTVLEKSGAPSLKRTRGALFVVRKLVWSIALLTMGFFAVDGFLTFDLQNGAPQQAAAAASACFHLITPYVIARALDELLRSERVKIDTD